MIGEQVGNYVIGQVGGTETVTVLSTQLPQHNHSWAATSNIGNVVPPTGAFLAGAVAGAGNTPLATYGAAGGATVPLSTNMLTSTGGSQPHNDMQPYLVINYCIALQGIFPSRN